MKSLITPDDAAPEELDDTAEPDDAGVGHEATPEEVEEVSRK